jgi:hypothetical protein
MAMENPTEGTRESMEESTRDASKAFAIFTAIMVLVMIFPVYGIANRVEPMVLGMPFSLFWIVA